MIIYNSNVQDVVTGIITKVIGISTPGSPANDKMLRTIASTITAKMLVRVHQKGIAADGTKIGTYSASYMRVRTGLYSDSKVISSGKNAGIVKSAGVYSKRKVKGENGNTFEKGNFGERKKYNRSTDRTVVLSLTRQMENDMAICEENPLRTGYGYAVGYQSDFNFQKAIWCEQTYKKKILSDLSSEEYDLVNAISNQSTEDAVNN